MPGEALKARIGLHSGNMWTVMSDCFVHYVTQWWQEFNGKLELFYLLKTLNSIVIRLEMVLKQYAFKTIFPYLKTWLSMILSFFCVLVFITAHGNHDSAGKTIF